MKCVILAVGAISLGSVLAAPTPKPYIIDVVDNHGQTIPVCVDSDLTCITKREAAPPIDHYTETFTLGSAFNHVADAAGDVVAKIEDAVDGVEDKVGDEVDSVEDTVAEEVDSVEGKVGDAVKSVEETVGGIKAREAAPSADHNMKTFTVRSALNHIANLPRDIAAVVEDVADDVKDEAEEICDEAHEVVGDVAGDVEDATDVEKTVEEVEEIVDDIEERSLSPRSTRKNSFSAISKVIRGLVRARSS